MKELENTTHIRVWGDLTEERKGGARESGEPRSMAASVSSTVFAVRTQGLESVIPVLAVFTFSTTGEDECTDNECYYN